MRRLTTPAVLMVVAMTGVLFGGCAAPGAGASKTATAPAKVAVAKFGTRSLDEFIPLAATSFSSGIAAIGTENSSTSTTDSLPAILRADEAATWDVQRLGALRRSPSGAAQLGSTRVVVGVDDAFTFPQRPGSAVVPFVAVSANDGPWEIHDVGESAFGGKSAELNDIGLTGSPGSSDAQFITVGGTVSAPSAELGHPDYTRPVAFTSSDGSSWQPTTDLPLPNGVTGADAASVTYAPEGTAFPGVIVVGTGWANDQQIGRRTVAIVWQSPDAGQSWKIVSDDKFNQDGRDMSADYIAADGDTIVAAGSDDVPGQKGDSSTVRQTEGVDWAADSDGQWHVISDGPLLAPNRSSLTTALIARPGRGFLTATEVYDESGSPSSAEYGVAGNSAAKVWSSSDGINYSDITQSIPDMRNASVISAIAEFGNRVVFFGLDDQSHSKAYVVDGHGVK